MESNTQNKIFQEKTFQKGFTQIVKDFENKFKSFYKPKDAILIKKYWGANMGIQSALKELNYKSDFKGLYIFLNEERPFYVGISKNVIKRINDHIKGKSHETATLAYSIGIIDYESKHGKPYNGTRKNFDFSTYVKPIQEEFLMNSKLLFTPIDDDNELYLFEVYCSMKLKTQLNTFETH